MRKLVFIILFLTAGAFQAQVRNSPFLQNVVISFEGGLTVAKTDYKTSLVGTGNRGMLEYFFGSIKNHTFGFRIFGGGQNIRGKDNRKEYPSFRSGMYFTGAGFTYLYELQKSLIPYASAEFSYLWLNTEQENNEIQNNRLTRETGLYTFALETGARFRVMNNLFFNLSAAVNFLSDDMLDNTELGINNDFYIKTMAGFSFSFFSRNDSDDDGIDNDEDACIEAAEDVDGFDDDDGCPDPDNDNDGIPDVDDKCPDLAEDPDGFEDGDGCPDLDNDKDGIADKEDQCANMQEDVDGYQDDDGCPEYDNDGDGILDVNDRCPEIAEDFDGYQDEDGCADLDNDGDGIFDDRDKCPDQPETVNNFEDDDGCPDVLPKKVQPDQYIEPERPSVRNERTETVRPRTETKPEVKEDNVRNEVPPSSSSNKYLLHGVTTFEEEASNELNPQAYAELDRIAADMKKKGGKWRIEGYVDNSLSEKEAVDLSRKRAQAVYKYLVSKGVSGSQLEVSGMGSKNPIESNDKVFGRMKNRRIEIKQVR